MVAYPDQRTGEFIDACWTRDVRCFLPAAVRPDHSGEQQGQVPEALTDFGDSLREVPAGNRQHAAIIFELVSARAAPVDPIGAALGGAPVGADESVSPAHDHCSYRKTAAKRPGSGFLFNSPHYRKGPWLPTRIPNVSPTCTQFLARDPSGWRAKPRCIRSTSRGGKSFGSATMGRRLHGKRRCGSAPSRLAKMVGSSPARMKALQLSTPPKNGSRSLRILRSICPVIASTTARSTAAVASGPGPWTATRKPRAAPSTASIETCAGTPSTPATRLPTDRRSAHPATSCITAIRRGRSLTLSTWIRREMPAIAGHSWSLASATVTRTE